MDHTSSDDVEDIGSEHHRCSLHFGCYNFHASEAPSTGAVILPNLEVQRTLSVTYPPVSELTSTCPSYDYLLFCSPESKTGPQVRQARGAGA